jgi:hypothetical protein
MAEQKPGGEMLPKHHDDFKQIKGIGQAIAQAMHQLGLHRFADLASLTPEKLYALLHAQSVGAVSIARIEREDWLGQARELAKSQVGESASQRNEISKEAGSADTPETASAAPSPAMQENLPAFMQDASLQANDPIQPHVKHIRNRPNAGSGVYTRRGASEGIDPEGAGGPQGGGWRELGDFFVSFGESISEGGQARLKTKVDYSQFDRHMEWDGIAMDALVRWMREQANLPGDEPEQPGPGPQEGTTHIDPPIFASETDPDENLTLAVSNVWVSQVSPEDLPRGRTGQRWIRVQATVEFSVADMAAMLEWPESFTINILLVNTSTNASLFIELPAVPFTPDLWAYPFQHDFPVPPPGRYQLYLLTRLPSARHALAYTEGPLVRVEG